MKSPRNRPREWVAKLYELKQDIGGHLFSWAISSAFQEFGAKSLIVPPIRLHGSGWIRIGKDVYVGEGCWLRAGGIADGVPEIVIGDGASIAGYCVVSAVKSVIIEANVLIARNVYISDHIHRYRDGDVPIKNQGVDKVGRVVIGEGSWLGQNVVVCPGVRIGAYCVVGANSVVNRDIPAKSVAVGAPARVCRNSAEDIAEANNDQDKMSLDALQECNYAK